MWLYVNIRLALLALPVWADLYSHTSVCLDSRLICHSQMSSGEAAVSLIWLPRPQGHWTQPCHHSPPTSPPIALPSHLYGKSCTTQAWPAQEHFPPLCFYVCVPVIIQASVHMTRIKQCLKGTWLKSYKVPTGWNKCKTTNNSQSVFNNAPVIGVDIQAEAAVKFHGVPSRHAQNKTSQLTMSVLSECYCGPSWSLSPLSQRDVSPTKTPTAHSFSLLDNVAHVGEK